MRIRKIVSGGQSGVDRAALDVAAALGLEVGGWCPAGRRSEEGPIPHQYDLRETPSADYRQRTEWNVRDSDATLIVAGAAPLTGGTRLTRDFAKSYGRPIVVIDVYGAVEAEVRSRIEQMDAEVLNIAGPRESELPGVYDATRRLLERVLTPV